MTLKFLQEGAFNSGNYQFTCGSVVEVTEEYGKYLVETFEGFFEKLEDEVKTVVSKKDKGITKDESNS